MVTNSQIKRLRILINKGFTQEIVAEETGIAERNDKKCLKGGKLPDELRKDHTWRTKEDPFKEDKKRIREMLSDNPALEAKTVFEYLSVENPERYNQGQLRTLQRRFRMRRAFDGPAKEVIFPQVHIRLTSANQTLQA